MIESNADRNRMDALLDALAEDEDDPVGEGRRFLLGHIDQQVRDALDERDPMLAQIKRDDEWFRRESREWDR